MGKSQRTKGKAAEREVVNLAREFGLQARRTWHLADSELPFERCCDVEISGKAHQVKRRKRAYSDLYEALRGVRAAFVRADGREWLVVLPAKQYLAQMRYDEIFGDQNK